MYKEETNCMCSPFQPANSCEAWMPLHFITKIFGYAPFTLKNQKFYTSMGDLILPFASIIVYVFLFAFNFWIPVWKAGQSSYLLDIGMNASVILSDFTAVFIVLSNIINRQKIISIFETIHHIDNELIKLGAVINFPKHLMTIFGCILTSTISQVLLVVISFYLRNHFNVRNFHISMAILYTAVTLAYTIYMTNFVFIVVNISSRYRLINQILKQYFLKKSMKTTSGLGHVCTKLGKLHDQLGDTVDNVNECLAFQVKFYK